MASIKTQRGNILFLILLAVVLFAALSYAVTQSLRGGGNDAGNEKATAQASDLLNYFAQIDGAVQRMMLTNGVKDYELNFFLSGDANGMYNGNNNNNCTTNQCKIFNSEGGAVAPRKLTEFTKGDLTRPVNIYYVKVPGVGSDADDVVIGLLDVKTKICRDINSRFGTNDMLTTSNVSGEDATTVMYSNPVPIGPIPVSGKTITNVPAAAYTAGTWCSCIYSTSSTCETDTYRPVIYHVLVAR